MVWQRSATTMKGVGQQQLRPDRGRDSGGISAEPSDGRGEGIRPLQRLRVRGLAWPHPDAADAQRLTAASRRTARAPKQLISGVDNGIYIVGDKSWSIDMQRYNFQFTGQRFFKIDKGRLAGQLKDVAYQATTTDFWRSMEAVGNPRPTSWAARSTAARDSLARSRRCRMAARPRCSAGSTC